MSLVQEVANLQNYEEFADLNWTGSFEDYLNIVRERPEVTRTAYQRLYDMILSYGYSEHIDNKKRIFHYNFFDDPLHGGVSRGSRRNPSFKDIMANRDRLRYNGPA